MCNPNTEGRDPETGGHDTVTIENTKDKPLAQMYISVFAPCLPTEFSSKTNVLFVRRGTGKHCLKGR